MTFNLGILTTGLRLYERFCNKRFSFMCQHITNLSCPSAVTLNLGVLSECTYDVKKLEGPRILADTGNKHASEV